MFLIFFIADLVGGITKFSLSVVYKGVRIVGKAVVANDDDIPPPIPTPLVAPFSDN